MHCSRHSPVTTTMSPRTHRSKVTRRAAMVKTAKATTADPGTPKNTASEMIAESHREQVRVASLISPVVQESSSSKPSVRVAAPHGLAIVTPSETPSSTSEESSADQKDEITKKSPRRVLFSAPGGLSSTSSSLVTPSSLLQVQVQAKRKSTTSTVQHPPSKRRLIFGRLVEQIHCNPNVKHLYGIVRKLTGSIGGNGYSGPIYGELTMGSMAKMIQYMMDYTELSSSSRFIDVGSGIGKPNLHVAQYPGVEFSCGVEMEQVRWSLGMTCLKAVLDAAAVQQQQQQQQDHLSPQEALQGNCMFLHKNITEAKSFDPFTHVYMFSIGFPPPLWLELSEMWNKSHSEYLICYHGPRAIIADYEFDVELLAQTQTSMHGSKEGHMGYLYKRKTPVVSTGEECDALFADSWNLVKSGFEPLRQAVTAEMDENMGVGPRTRSSRRQLLTRS